MSGRARVVGAGVLALVVAGLGVVVPAEGQRGGAGSEVIVPGQGNGPAAPGAARGRGRAPPRPRRRRRPASHRCRATCSRRRTSTSIGSPGPTNATRCNTPRQLTDMWARETRPSHWGNCNLDYPVEKIVSPYMPTAEEHYNALMAEARRPVRPTVHTRQTLPDWDSYYQRGGREDQWIWGRNGRRRPSSRC